MREFKFKAWIPIFDEMREVASIDFTSDTLKIKGDDTLFNFNDSFAESFDTARLMQYTGLKDCKEREIYENDILKLPSGKITAVSFMFGSFCYDEDFTTNLCNINANSEIIGNTYENAYLLDKKGE